MLIPRDAFLKIVKDAGGNTTTDFNFTLSGGATAPQTVKGGASVTVPIKSATATSVVETVPTDWTFTSATCDGPTPGTPITNGREGVKAAEGVTVTCTFVNALQPNPVITINKSCPNGAHAATDRFQPVDETPNPDVTAGSPLACDTGTTDYSPNADTAFSIREVAGSTTPATNLANYTTTYSPGCTSTGLARGATGTCTITNTLKALPVITINKVCPNGAHAATDRFQPVDETPNPDVTAGSPLACDTGTTDYSPNADTAFSIREVAGSKNPATNLANYTTTYCRDSAQHRPGPWCNRHLHDHQHAEGASGDHDQQGVPEWSTCRDRSFPAGR